MPNPQLLKHVVQGAIGVTKAYSGVGVVYQDQNGTYKWQYVGAPIATRVVSVIKDGRLTEIGRDATPEEVEFINLVIQIEGENTNV